MRSFVIAVMVLLAASGTLCAGSLTLTGPDRPGLLEGNRTTLPGAKMASIP